MEGRRGGGGRKGGGRKGKERKGKQREGKERNGEERKGKEMNEGRTNGRPTARTPGGWGATAEGGRQEPRWQPEGSGSASS